MKVSHRTLASLPRGYSIAVIPGTEADGLPSFVAGSEGDSQLLLFESPEFSPVVIADLPGGFISTWPLRIDGRQFLAASTLFKPGFNAADSRLQLYPLDQGERPEPSLIGEMPYTQRFKILEHNGAQYLLASTL